MSFFPGACSYITQLPTEILRDIIGHFSLVYDDTEGVGTGQLIQIHDDEEAMIRRQTLQRLRLTCRSFSHAASSLLLPFLKVDLNEASLDRARKICEASTLAPHIKGVQVGLLTYSKELAESLERFTAYQLQKLDALEDSSGYLFDDLDGVEDMDDYDEDKKMHEAAVEAWRGFRGAWTHTAQSTADGGGHERLLLQAHSEYRKRYEEQVSLISSGHFTQALASAISPLTCSVFVQFSASGESSSLQEEFVDVIGNQGKMLEFILAPHSWKEMEAIGRHSTLQAAVILTELQMAIHAAGGDVLSVSIACFPHPKNYAQLFGNLRDKQAEAVSALKQSCRSLETFHFGKTGLVDRGVQPDFPSHTERAYMDDYLRVMLSSLRLEDLCLNFYAFSQTHGTGALRQLRPLGGALSSLQTRRLRRIEVIHASLTFAELDALILAVDRNIEAFTLNGVELSSGSWADILDALSIKTAARCREGRCTLQLWDLYGGEFIMSASNDQESPDAQRDRKARVDAVEQYLCGSLPENPLREDRSKTK